MADVGVGGGCCVMSGRFPVKQLLHPLGKGESVLLLPDRTIQPKDHYSSLNEYKRSKRTK